MRWLELARSEVRQGVNELHVNYKGPHQRPFVMVPLSGSVGAVGLVGEVSRGHAVVQGLLIAAKACIDARLALASEVLGVVGNVGVGVGTRRSSWLKPLREALRPGQGDWAVALNELACALEVVARLGRAGIARLDVLGGSR